MQSYDGLTGEPFTNIYHDILSDGKHHLTGERLPLVIGRAVGGNNKANARLIAAAPDLLAALEWLAREVRASAPMMRECIGNTNLNALMLREEQARAAIAKAKGETQ